jgi:hypothetical protein
MQSSSVPTRYFSLGNRSKLKNVRDDRPPGRPGLRAEVIGESLLAKLGRFKFNNAPCHGQATHTPQVPAKGNTPSASAPLLSKEPQTVAEEEAMRGSHRRELSPNTSCYEVHAADDAL